MKMHDPLQKKVNKNHTHTHTDAHTSLAPPAVKSTHNPQSLMDKLRKVGRITLFLQVSVFKTNTKSVCTMHCDRGHNSSTQDGHSWSPGKSASQRQLPLSSCCSPSAMYSWLSCTASDPAMVQWEQDAVTLRCSDPVTAVQFRSSNGTVSRSSHRSAV